MKQEARKKFLKRCRTIKAAKSIRDQNFNEEEIMSKNKLHQFRKIKNENNNHSNDSKNK
jgi:hypothetical protein